MPAAAPGSDPLSDAEDKATDDSEEEAELIPHEAVADLDRLAEGPVGGQEAPGGADGKEETESEEDEGGD